ncbi:unnamed protein product [Wickerhamomyces anomalus]
MVSSVPSLSLVPQQAVVYAAANASANSTGNGTHGGNSSNSTKGSSSAKSGAAMGVVNPISWKYGVAIGALVASPFVLSLGF